MLATIPRWTTSSRSSLCVQRVIGRPDNFGDSHATATISATVVRVGAADLNGVSVVDAHLAIAKANAPPPPPPEETPAVRYGMVAMTLSSTSMGLGRAVMPCVVRAGRTSANSSA